MLPSLYVIADEYTRAIEELANMDADEQTIADTLEGLQGTLELKATNVAMFVQNLEATAEAIKAAEQKMADRRKAIENRVERVRKYLKENMEKAGISKIECPEFRLSIQNNPPSVIIEDAGAIPDEYKKLPEPPPLTPDKKLIGAALKSGMSVPGAWLETKTRLVIK